MAYKRIAVIGAGPMGIIAMKCLKEEDLEPVCFEKTNDMGGLWRYRDDDVEGLASVMKSTIVNSSKEMSAISDFPPGDDVPNYMHNRLVLKMFMDYSKAFDLEKHVHFHKEVVEVTEADNYDVTGCLIVTVKDTKTQEVTSATFDGVVVCIGHHVYPNVPSFPGLEKFKGKVMHTHSLKNARIFEDQVVAVVGVGNSGTDAAVEISSVAKQVYLSSRRGTWVTPRVGPKGMPLDLIYTRRYLAKLFDILPYSFSCWIFERFLNERFDHSMYNLKPKHRVFSQQPTNSDRLPLKLISGMVAVRKNIKQFVSDGVVFEKEDAVTQCDIVVMATGYQIKFPFLSERLTTVKDNSVYLYKYVYPPHLKHPTLAFGGLVQTVGGGFPAFEAQARWLSQVFRGNVSLPTRSEMEADILKKREENAKRYIESQRHTIQADYILYLDEIYSMIGAKPNLWKIFFTDPVLFWTLFFGPSLPYQYRLQGPHPWPGSRKASLGCSKRVTNHLNSNYETSLTVLNSIYVFCFVIFSAFLIITFLLL